MGKVDKSLTQIFQSGKQRELGTIVRGDCLEDIIPVLAVLIFDFLERRHDTVWIPAGYTDHPVFPGLPLDHRKQSIIVSAL